MSFIYYITLTVSMELIFMTNVNMCHKQIDLHFLIWLLKPAEDLEGIK